jgi:UDP-glucose 4-epimerase
VQILITGGRGFLGGRIAAYLAKAGHRIVIGSTQSRSAPRWLSSASTAVLNWNDQASLTSACRGADVVIHAAGMNAQDCAKNPTDALLLNGVGTSRLVDAAQAERVTRFIYLSTAHVYTNPLIGLITEETSTQNLHPYSTSHLAGEHAVLHADSAGVLEGVVLRLSNAYGAPMDTQANCWTLLANDLCKQAFERQRLCLRTAGLERRDFVPIDRVCQLVEYYAAVSLHAKKRGLFNVGSGASQTVLEFAQFIQARCSKVFGFTPPLIVAPRLNERLSEELHFKSTRSTHFENDACVDANKEIDDLLAFCSNNFSPNSAELTKLS